MKSILVTNDDGVHSEGIKTLAEAVAGLGDVTIVAPMQEASAIGHALTLRRPLRVEPIAPRTFGVDGTPTDCVNLAISHILGKKPDLIVSGINKGWNLGDDVTYSGTVSGALEGALLGIAAIAVSTQNKGRKNVFEFSSAAKAAATLSELVLERGLPKFMFLNVNAPYGPSKGLRITVQARRNHITVVDERVDPRGRAYYWIEEGQNEWEPHDRSDYQAVRDGYTSVTPLQPDMTALEGLRYLEGLPLESPASTRS